jgi:hypothetical protein
MTIFVAVALNLVPFFASDYPEHDKSHYYKLYCQWNAQREHLVTVLLDHFCRGDTKLNMAEFISRASAFPEYFDTLGIREEVKREIALLEETSRNWQGAGTKPPAPIVDFTVPGQYS